MASKDLALVRKQMFTLRFKNKLLCYLFVLGPGAPAPSVPKTGENLYSMFDFSCL